MRLIDAGDVMDAVFNAIDIDEKQWNEIKQEVDEIPTIDPESLRPTAKWEKSFYESREEGRFIVCTRCRHAFSKKGLWCRKYCPECGARMVNYENVTK
ncbi:hypothetical protein [Gemmiger sp.]